MGKELFSSVNMQRQKCGICYSDDPKDLKESGPIYNHRVNQHPGFHFSCLKTWLLMNPICPICKDELELKSFSLKGKEVKPFLSKEIMHNALIFGTILLVFAAVMSCGVFVEKIDLSAAATSFSAFANLCLVAFIGSVFFEAMPRQNEDHEIPLEFYNF